MPETVKMNVCIVWTEELRAASVAIHEFVDKMKEKDADKHGFQESLAKAVDACYAALYGVKDATHIVACDAKKGAKR